jgi:hypothetical protein
VSHLASVKITTCILVFSELFLVSVYLEHIQNLG